MTKMNIHNLVKMLHLVHRHDDAYLWVFRSHKNPLEVHIFLVMKAINFFSSCLVVMSSVCPQKMLWR